MINTLSNQMCNTQLHWGKVWTAKGWDPGFRLSPGSPAPLSCTHAFLEWIVLQYNKTIKSQGRAGNTKHRRSQRLRNASACQPQVTQRVVPGVTVSLGAPGAAGSEFHSGVVERSRALPGLAVFNSEYELHTSRAPARSSFKSGLMLTYCSSFSFCAGS